MPEGFVKVIATKEGKSPWRHNSRESASELIHEWIIAIQHGVGLTKIMLTQHSFPTISLLNKRIASGDLDDEENGFIFASENR